MGKGEKMSFKDFIATSGTSNESTSNNLPTGPRERTNGDDGSFRRDYGNRDGGMNGMSNRSDGENSWRRGGMGGGGSGFSSGRDHRGGGGYGMGGGGGGGGRENEIGRGDGDDNWRRGGGGGGMGSRGDRGFGGGMGGNSRFGGDDRRSSYGGGSDNSGGREGGSRWGHNDRMGATSNSYGSQGNNSERPRFNLSKRTVPMPEQPLPSAAEDDINTKNNATNTANAEEKPSIIPSSKPKSNPFGSATAVDTAAKLREMEIKEQEAKEKEEQRQKEEEEKEEAKESNGKEKIDDETEAKDTEIVDTNINSDNKDGNDKETEESNESEKDDNDQELESKEQAYKTDDSNEVKSGDETETAAIEAADSDKKNSNGKDKRDRGGGRKKPFEPKVINSRAALLGDAPAATSGNSGRRREVQVCKKGKIY